MKNLNHKNSYTPIIKSLKAKYLARRSLFEKIADWMSFQFGSTGFLLINVATFITWILINTEIIGFVPVFDPYPFGLLTTIVSLEAIVLSIVVLISQNRAAQIAEIREEIDLQVDRIAEQELTKLIKLTTILLKKHGVDVTKDRILKQMLKPIDRNQIENALERQILQ